MGTLLARRKHNSPILDIGVQRITCPNIKPAAKRAWKNNLSLSGYLGLHGKTTLPLPRLFLPTYGLNGDGIDRNIAFSRGPFLSRATFFSVIRQTLLEIRFLDRG
jgi:hypothetical protein